MSQCHTTTCLSDSFSYFLLTIFDARVCQIPYIGEKINKIKVKDLKQQIKMTKLMASHFHFLSSVMDDDIFFPNNVTHIHAHIS